MKYEIRMHTGDSDMTMVNPENTMRVQTMDDLFTFEKNSEYKVTMEKVKS